MMILGETVGGRFRPFSFPPLGKKGAELEAAALSSDSVRLKPSQDSSLTLGMTSLLEAAFWGALIGLDIVEA